MRTVYFLFIFLGIGCSLYAQTVPLKAEPENSRHELLIPIKNDTNAYDNSSVANRNSALRSGNNVTINTDPVYFSDNPVDKFSDLIFTDDTRPVSWSGGIESGIYTPSTGIYHFNNDILKEITEFGRTFIGKGLAGGIYVEENASLEVKDITLSNMVMFKGGLMSVERGLFTFKTAPGASVTFSNVGNANHGGYAYGGIFHNAGGILEVSGTEENPILFTGNFVSGNSNGNGGAILTRKYQGEGEYSWNRTSVDYGRFIENSAEDLGFSFAGGGGIGASEGFIDINNCYFEGNKVNSKGNTTEAIGGGISGTIDGVMRIYNSTVYKNEIYSQNSYAQGGGIGIQNHHLTLESVKIIENNATGRYAIGGGLCYVGQNYKLTGKDVLFSKNTANDLTSDGSGGGFYNNLFSGQSFIEGKQTELSEVRFEENKASSSGGGVYSGMKDAYFTDAVFLKNEAHWGGGLFVSSRKVFLKEATLDNNIAVQGGAIYIQNPAEVSIEDGIIKDNIADYGSGVYNYGKIKITDTDFKTNITSSQYGGAIFSAQQQLSNGTLSTPSEVEINVSEGKSYEFSGNMANTNVPNSVYQERSGSITVNTEKDARLNMFDPMYIYTHLDGDEVTITKKGEGIWYLGLESVYEQEDEKGAVDFTVEKGALIVGKDQATSSDAIRNMTVKVLSGGLIGGYGNVESIHLKEGTIAPASSSKEDTEYSYFSMTDLISEEDSHMLFALGAAGANIQTLGEGDYIFTDKIDVRGTTYIDIEPGTGFGEGKYLLIKYTAGEGNGLDNLALSTSFVDPYNMHLDIDEDGAVYLIVTKPHRFFNEAPAICEGGSTVIPVTFKGTAPWSFEYRTDKMAVEEPNVVVENISVSPFELTVTPTSTTTYYLKSVNDANGIIPITEELEKTTIVVAPYPQVSPIEGASEVYTGNSIQLTNPTQGGTWMVDNTGIATISADGQLTGITQGTVEAWYVVTGPAPTSCESITTHTVQVRGRNINPDPDPDPDPDPEPEPEPEPEPDPDPDPDPNPDIGIIIHSGTEACYSDALFNIKLTKMYNGTLMYIVTFTESSRLAGFEDIKTYKEIPADGIITIDVPGGITAGTYSGYIIVREPDSTDEIPFPFSVKIKDGVTIVEQPQPITRQNTNEPFRLSVEAQGENLTYQWFYNGQRIEGANLPTYEDIYNAEKEGIYYVEVYGDCGWLQSDEASVTGCFGVLMKWDDVLYVQNTDDRYTHFQWYRNEEQIRTYGTSIYYTDPDGLQGSYYVRAYKSDGTYDQSCPVEFSVVTRSSSVSVYPTIVERNHYVNVESDEPGGSYTGGTVDIYNSSGGKVYSQRLLDTRLQITINQPSGVYILHVTATDGRRKTEKIIVK